MTNSISQRELDAELKAIEAKFDGRVARVEGLIERIADSISSLDGKIINELSRYETTVSREVARIEQQIAKDLKRVEEDLSEARVEARAEKREAQWGRRGVIVGLLGIAVAAYLAIMQMGMQMTESVKSSNSMLLSAFEAGQTLPRDEPTEQAQSQDNTRSPRAP